MIARYYCEGCGADLTDEVQTHHCPLQARLADARAERVNHPAHYGGDAAYEAIKVIEAWVTGSRVCPRCGRRFSSALGLALHASWVRRGASTCPPLLPFGARS